MMPANERPAELGYRWPAEWEPHAATWLAWPHNRQTWPGKFEPIPPLFAQLVRTIALYETVNVLAGGEVVASQAKRLVGDLNNVVLHDIPTNDAWTRDHGPTFLVGPAGQPPALVDWQYNAWGGKYPPFDKDNDVPRQIAQRLSRRRFTAQLVLEGGGIDGNGCGTVLTTPSCLLNRNRNPGATRGDVERYLHDYLGAEKVLWLSGGEIVGDDTDGHIDQLARFVSPTVVVAAVEENPHDENYGPLAANLAQLSRMTNSADQPLQVVPIPMPRPVLYEGHRLPASYLNFYIANGLVVVPQFDDPADEIAREILGQLFPNHDVRGLPTTDLVWGLGAFHCLTQQEPSGE
jgi:agmatine deiminase